jgi:hypothetical protein
MPKKIINQLMKYPLGSESPFTPVPNILLQRKVLAASEDYCRVDQKKKFTCHA